MPELTENISKTSIYRIYRNDIFEIFFHPCCGHVPTGTNVANLAPRLKRHFRHLRSRGGLEATSNSSMNFDGWWFSQKNILPLKFNSWNLKMDGFFKRNLLFQGLLFRFHVKLGEGTCWFDFFDWKECVVTIKMWSCSSQVSLNWT